MKPIFCKAVYLTINNEVSFIKVDRDDVSEIHMEDGIFFIYYYESNTVNIVKPSEYKIVTDKESIIEACTSKY